MNRFSLGAVVLASSLVVGCGTIGTTGASGSQSQAQALVVSATAAQRRDIRQTLSFSGDVRAREQITVLPKASGRVQRVLVDLGSVVHAGDVLAELEQDSPEIQVSQARANLAAAQAKLSIIQAGGRADDVSAANEALAQ